MRRIARGAGSWRDEAGVALPVALISLVAVTILVTGVLLSSATGSAIASAHQDGKASLYRAEGALEEYIQTQRNALGNSTLAPLAPTVQTLPSGAQARISVAQLGQFFAAPTDRLGTRYFAVTAEPVRPNGDVLGRSVVSLVPVQVQRVTMNLNITGAATLASQDVTISGSSFVSGKQDARLCATGSNLKAVTLASDADDIRIDAKNIDGGLAEVETSTRTGEQLAQHALDANHPRTLAQFANIKFGLDGKPAFNDQDPSSSYPRTSSLNWGCPLKLLTVFGGGTCGLDDVDYYPTIAIDAGTGSAKLNGGHGQGLLIVLGDLDITGKFYFSGVVIVTGRTYIRGSGGESRIDGALIGLGNVLVDPSTGGGNSDESSELLGNAKVFYNSCTVASAVQAFNANSANQPLQLGRMNQSTEGWMELVR